MYTGLEISSSRRDQNLRRIPNRRQPNAESQLGSGVYLQIRDFFKLDQ